MKLYVPSLGDKLVLTKPWTFPLYGEWRNSTLFDALGVSYPMTRSRTGDGEVYEYRDSYKAKSVTLSAGTELTVRRIYIRNGQRDFDSLTFSAVVTPPATAKKKSPKPAKVRFWAKLRDCDGIEFERGEQ